MVVNGDFTVDSTATYTAECPSYWSCTADHTFVVNGSTTSFDSGPAPSGMYFVALWHTPGDLYQSLTLSSAYTYQFTFYARNRVGTTAPTFTVYVGSTVLLSATAPTAWTQYTLYYTPSSSGLYNLKFDNTYCSNADNAYCSLLLDNITSYRTFCLFEILLLKF